MAAKDVSDAQVVRACADFHRDPANEDVIARLVRQTLQPAKVCVRALERACERGLIDYGVSLRTAWVTTKGESLLKETP